MFIDDPNARYGPVASFFLLSQCMILGSFLGHDGLGTDGLLANEVHIRPGSDLVGGMVSNEVLVDRALVVSSACFGLGEKQDMFLVIAYGNGLVGVRFLPAGVRVSRDSSVNAT